MFQKGGSHLLSRILSCVLNGLDGNITEVEVDISNGLPALKEVGNKP